MALSSTTTFSIFANFSSHFFTQNTFFDLLIPKISWLFRFSLTQRVSWALTFNSQQFDEFFKICYYSADFNITMKIFGQVNIMKEGGSETPKLDWMDVAGLCQSWRGARLPLEASSLNPEALLLSDEEERSLQYMNNGNGNLPFQRPSSQNHLSFPPFLALASGMNRCRLPIIPHKLNGYWKWPLNYESESVNQTSFAPNMLWNYLKMAR